MVLIFMKGKILFKYGNMSSGKSLHLLATAHNFEQHSIPFLIFKSNIDNRDGDEIIHSRALGDRECIGISPTHNLYKIVGEYLERCFLIGETALKWVLVDECQFLTEKQVGRMISEIGLQETAQQLSGAVIDSTKSDEKNA